MAKNIVRTTLCISRAGLLPSYGGSLLVWPMDLPLALFMCVQLGILRIRIRKQTMVPALLDKWFLEENLELLLGHPEYEFIFVNYRGVCLAPVGNAADLWDHLEPYHAHMMELGIQELERVATCQLKSDHRPPSAPPTGSLDKRQQLASDQQDPGRDSDLQALCIQPGAAPCHETTSADLIGGGHPDRAQSQATSHGGGQGRGYHLEVLSAEQFHQRGHKDPGSQIKLNSNQYGVGKPIGEVMRMVHQLLRLSQKAGLIQRFHAMQNHSPTQQVLPWRLHRILRHGFNPSDHGRSERQCPAVVSPISLPAATRASPEEYAKGLPRALIQATILSLKRANSSSQAGPTLAYWHGCGQPWWAPVGACQRRSLPVGIARPWAPLDAWAPTRDVLQTLTWNKVFRNVMLAQMWRRHTCGAFLYWGKQGMIALRKAIA